MKKFFYGEIVLINGREMSIVEALMDYERILQEKELEERTMPQQKVGEWFIINRETIEKKKNLIENKCLRIAGEEICRRFENSRKIANEKEYPVEIETYIFEKSWTSFKTEEEMRNMCFKIGKGMCNEIICDLELQMRLCNGELAENLLVHRDRLPHVRMIELTCGGTGFFGGGTNVYDNYPPAHIKKKKYDPNMRYYKNVPYAYR